MNTFPKAHLMQAAENAQLDQDFVRVDPDGTIAIDFESHKQMAMFLVDLAAVCHYQGDDQAQKDMDDLIDMTDKIRIFQRARGIGVRFAGWTWE
jgi:hypothetical protein